MRAAIRFSEYKAAGKLPHREKFDCSTCIDTPAQVKRNCRGEHHTKYRYTIGTTQFSQCPVSVYAFDSEVIQVINLVLTSLESGIPVAGTDLLGQTQAFFDFVATIRDEKAICYGELEQIRKDEAKKEEAAAKRRSAGSRPHTPRRR